MSAHKRFSSMAVNYIISPLFKLFLFRGHVVAASCANSLVNSAVHVILN